jgi:hypothetical protein
MGAAAVALPLTFIVDQATGGMARPMLTGFVLGAFLVSRNPISNRSLNKLNSADLHLLDWQLLHSLG